MARAGVRAPHQIALAHDADELARGVEHRHAADATLK
jgi:hypothetical protein